jgi:hypothetical protein
MPANENEADADPKIDVGLFVARMQQPNIVAELFFPTDQASWVGAEYQLNNNAKPQVARNSGARLQDTRGNDESSRKREQVQWDMSHVVSSVVAMRSNKGMECVVLSKNSMRTKDENKVSRVKFGLKIDECFSDDTAAAEETHRNIVRTIGKSGFKVEHPKSFDSSCGMIGLAEWAKELSLKRKWRPPLWCLLLLLLPFLLFLRGCKSDEFIGMPVSTGSLVIIVDRSSSMKPHMPLVRAEVKRLLASWQSTLTSRYVNIIAYDSEATSALGEVKKVDQQTIDELTDFLNNLEGKGGTNLESGIEVAAREIAKHERPVTAIVLTDGMDPSVGDMLGDLKSVKDSFHGVDVRVMTCTPRLFNGGDATPINAAEGGLKNFAERLNGQFGSETNAP